jgi:hypothetical protein
MEMLSNMIDTVAAKTSMTQSSVRSIGLASAAVLAAATVYLAAKGPSADSGLAPALTEEEATAVMTAILDSLKLTATRFLRHVEQMKQQIAAGGQSVPEKELMKYMLPHFETALKEIENTVYTDKDVEASEVEDAVNTYIAAGHEKLSEICQKIRLIYKEFGGELDGGEESSDMGAGVGSSGAAGEKGTGSSGGSGKDVSLNDVLEILTVLSEKIGGLTEEYVAEFIEQHGLPNGDAELTQRFQMGMMALSEQAEKVVLEEFAISITEFQQAVMANQASPAIQQKIMEMQFENQQRMMQQGIKMQ